MSEKKPFKPYISPETKMRELTLRSIILGILIAIIFGGANAYLGLKVGMTISASIPAAVISMGIFRLFKCKDSILESNLVQTIGSAGESLAAGVVYTMPVFFLWAKEGVMPSPNILLIILLAIIGGILGTLFMVPLRKPLIVDEHETLPYPEGTACAQVLLAGEKDDSSSRSIFVGIAAAAAIKFIIDGVKLIPEAISVKLNSLKTELSLSSNPALFSVGYIIGSKVSNSVFAGSVLSWLVLIPAIYLFGQDATIAPSTESIASLYASGGASAIWNSYIRYIGAGAVAMAGIINLIKSLPMIVKAFSTSVGNFNIRKSRENDIRTNRDLPFIVIGICLLISLLMIWLLPAIPINLLGAILVFVFSFFFATVASKVVGMVGSSNSPISGMTIATLLISTLLLKLSGISPVEGMSCAIAIASVVCIVAAMAGDTSQDLKTGFLLGATPIKQQIGELIGALFAATSIGGVLILLDKAWGFGSNALPAPQANLMKIIVEGVIKNELPWGLLAIGAFLAIVFELLGLSSLTIAIGCYLPLGTTSCIFIGGLLRKLVDKKHQTSDSDDGIMICSGMIAGEGLMGILMAVLVVTGIADKLDLSHFINFGQIGTIIIILVILAIIAKQFIFRRKQ